jgi:hypothetical protein
VSLPSFVLNRDPLTPRQTCNILFQPPPTPYFCIIHDFLHKFSDPSQHHVYLSTPLSPRLPLHLHLSSPHRPQNLYLPFLCPVKRANFNRTRSSNRSSSLPAAHIIDCSDIVHSFAQRLGRFCLVVSLWHTPFGTFICTEGEATQRSSNRRT